MKLLMGNERRYTPEELAPLRALGLEICLLGREKDECPAEYTDAEIISGYMFFKYHNIADFPHLRVIQTTSAGTDHLPWDHIRAHGITVYNARGVYSAPMAEFALCGVLQFYKHALRFRRQQDGHVWKQDMHLLELTGRRVLIVGSGSIGSECARRFAAMGCHVTGVCRHPAPAEYYDGMRSVTELDSLLGTADIVILSLPLTDETRHMMDARRIGLLKPDALLVNLSRGPVADTGALTAALTDGRIMGAVLDVFETEPLDAASPLWDLPNVIATPHNSFVGDQTRLRQLTVMQRNLSAWLRDREAGRV